MTPKQFATYIKRTGLSQRQLALELDVSRNTIAAYLSGSIEMPRVFDLALKAFAVQLKEREQ
jgi:transcriptional regulator with XRE-family HTH domain